MDYQTARRKSIEKWKRIANGERNDYGCKLCTYFHPSDARTIGHDECGKCPLHWWEPKEEKHSFYGHASYPCTRSYWKWAYWEGNGTRWERYWAKKIVEELEASPKHESEL